MNQHFQSWNLRLLNLEKDSIQADLCMVGVWKQKSLAPWVKKLDQTHQGAISQWLSSSYVEEDRETFRFLPNQDGNIKAKDIMLFSMGDPKKVTNTELRALYGRACKAVTMRGYKNVAIVQSFDKLDFSFAMEGFLLGSYRFSKYKSDPKAAQSLSSVSFFVNTKQKKNLQTQLDKIKITTAANFLARDLVNEPGNVIHPESFAKLAQDIAKKSSLAIKVLTKKELVKEKMNLIMAVGQASSHEPRLVHMHYKPSKKAKVKVALVGKGVTFDTGGLSLKPPGSMVNMKTDMAGAASVLATMQAIAQLKLPIEVHGILGLVENSVSSNATRPDDVVTSRAGKTVEIENTDAEGRLVLADALHYAEEQNVDYIIDAATLTGAVVIALGDEIAAVYSKDESLVKKLKTAADQVGDKLWHMPLEESYRPMLKSEIADLKNVGSGREGGSITAALFLSEFVKNTKWAHLDIAGAARATREMDLTVKGGTGIPSRTFIRFLENL